MIRLANRRFVPFYFDLNSRGAAGDPAAHEFVVAAREELGGRGVPTPPVLFMDSEGNVLGEVSNYATEEQLLTAMQQVLADHPEFNEPSEDETEFGSAVERAEVLIDLQDFDAARDTLADETSDAAQYLLGRLARFDHDWDAMDAHFAQVDDESLTDDVAMEKAYHHWHDGDFDALAEQLTEISDQSSRFSEAQYYLGLAKFHGGDRDAALETWQEMITACSEDPWVYRADWAHSGVTQGNRGAFSTGGPGTALGRIGYMGRRNPDLER